MIRLEMTMKKAIALLIPSLALGLTALAAAEDAKKPKKKCGAEATVCIREMAKGLKQRGWIGIEWQETEGRPEISLVVQSSPAAKAGVEVGDIVMAFNGVSTDEDDELMWAEMKRSLVPGKVITLAVVRNQAARDLQVELIAVPDHIVAQWVGKHVLESHAASPDAGASASP
jgi:serine protease Do